MKTVSSNLRQREATTRVKAALGLALAVSVWSADNLAQAAASVTYYGCQVNTPEWRSTGVPKIITLASGFGTVSTTAGYYGKDGYLLPHYTLGLPAYAPLGGITATGSDAFASPTYEQDVDDPKQPISAAVADLSAPDWAIVYQFPGAGVEANLFNFTLSAPVPSSFLLGVAFGNLDTPGEDPYGTASYRVSVGASGTAQIPAIANNKQIDWLFFRVDNATAGDTVRLFATGGTMGMASVAVIAFDPVPEPPSLGRTWDLESDFSTTFNPNGDWSYGYGYWGGTNFTALPQADSIFSAQGVSGGLNGWWLASDPVLLPVLAKNTNAVPLDVLNNIVPAGGILAHPGLADSHADIVLPRWTARRTGLYTVSARWTRLNPGPGCVSEAHIYKNRAGAPVHLFGTTTTVADPSVFLGADIPLDAGDTLDFMVFAAADGPNNDGVGLTVKITGGPVPEPPSLGRTWDLESDFSTTANPNGDWSYGYGYSGGTNFTALPQADSIFSAQGVSGGLNGWWLASDPVLLPVLAKNTNAVPLDVFNNIVPAGGILAHPGLADSHADIVLPRWTARRTGLYTVSARWTRLNPAPGYVSEAHIYKNRSGAPVHLFGAITTVASPSGFLGADIPLEAGDTLDFMVVAAADGPNCDGVGLTVKITGGPKIVKGTIISF